MLAMNPAFTLGITTSEVTWTSQGEGAYVDGFYSAGHASTTTIKASIQPLSGKERENLAEGVRDRAQAKCFTTAALKPGDEIADAACAYVVVDIDDWQALAGYTKALLGRKAA